MLLMLKCFRYNNTDKTKIVQVADEVVLTFKYVINKHRQEQGGKYRLASLQAFSILKTQDEQGF